MARARTVFGKARQRGRLPLTTRTSSAVERQDEIQGLGRRGLRVRAKRDGMTTASAPSGASCHWDVVRIRGNIVNYFSSSPIIYLISSAAKSSSAPAMSSPSPAPSNEVDDQPKSSPEPTQDPKEKGKETAVNNDTPSPDSSTATSPLTDTSASLSAGAWQAIFSPQHNTYYFYNASTGETTWVNPFQPSPSDLSSSDPRAQDTAANAQADGSDGTVDPNPYDPNSLEARAIAAGIDPSLAFLDPSLAGSSSLAHTGSFTAKFNARTGAFTATDARAPAHLSEYERMKRMSEFYFDVGAWEKDVEQRDAEEKEAGGKKRKRPTKKDLVSVCMSDFSFIIISFCVHRERRRIQDRNTSSTDGRTDASGSIQERFKEQKRLKKIAKTAWLRT